jgi:hypothetical protein
MAVRKKTVRRRRVVHHRAPVQHRAPVRHRRVTHRRKKGLAEGLASAGMEMINPILMGLMGAIAGIIVTNFTKGMSPVTRLLIGAAGAGAAVKLAKAPLLGAGFASGMALPSIVQLIGGQSGSNDSGVSEGNYLSEELPEILVDEDMSEGNYLSAANYLSEDSAFEDFE